MSNSNFSNYSITYYWNVSVNDGTDTNNSAIYHFTTEAINTSANAISPYEQTSSSLTINATASDKAEVITKLTEKGVITLNEARRKYNLKDIDGLNEVILPLNLAPMELHEKVLTPAPIIEPIEATVESTFHPIPEPKGENEEKIQNQIHKLQSELGRVKKLLGNSTP